MAIEYDLHTIEVGLIAEEPIRLEGLFSVFEIPVGEQHPILIPITGSLASLLARPTLRYLVLDLNSLPVFEQTLRLLRRERPEVRLIVIGPANDDDSLIQRAIMAGARAYLNINATPAAVRQAIDEVISGSIWAPRRLLTQLIDKLLSNPAMQPATTVEQLTEREQQVMELILMARSNREIAQQLGIEERTVKAYVGRLMRKAGAHNRIKLSMSSLGLAIKQQVAERDARSSSKEAQRTRPHS